MSNKEELIEKYCKERQYRYQKAEKLLKLVIDGYINTLKNNVKTCATIDKPKKTVAINDTNLFSHMIEDFETIRRDIGIAESCSEVISALQDIKE